MFAGIREFGVRLVIEKEPDLVNEIIHSSIKAQINHYLPKESN